MNSEELTILKNGVKLEANGKDLKDGEKKDEEDEEASFDSLIEQIGNDGKFQNRFNYLYNFVFVMLVSMPYTNYVLAMTVPDHWCYVPGRELTNYTEMEWKEKWLPREPGELSNETFSSCKMYGDHSGNSSKTIDCKYGWDYDKQWFQSTVVTEENWVCEREVFITNAYTAGSVGEILGTVILGQLGDLIGRRPVFYIALSILIIARLLLIWTTHIFWLFSVVMAVGYAMTITVYQSPFVITKRQDHIALVQCLGWVSGRCILPMINWLIRDWSTFMIVTTLPCASFFFLYKFMPESPRWLATKGKTYEAMQVLQHIAKINKTKMPENSLDILQKIADKKVKYKGVATLFNHWRLAKNTFLLVALCSAVSIIVYAIEINTTNLEGNPFMNFFWQSLAELPGYLFARILANFFGRRWSTTGACFLAAVSCAIMIGIHNMHIVGLQTVLLFLIKFCLTCSNYMAWLQALTIFPTCVRQTGFAFTSTITSILCIAAPYIVYLGTNIDSRLFYVVLFFLCLQGLISAMFLPETLDQKLPETLEEAYVFGKNQKFWSFAMRKKEKNDIKLTTKL